MGPPDPPQDTADDERGSSDQPPSRPTLPRGHTFRNTLSPKQSRLSANMSSSRLAPPPRQPRAALPRAGTFKLAKTGPPPPVGATNTGTPAGSSTESTGAEASPDVQPVPSRGGEASVRSGVRASLPRGHTFRAPRRGSGNIGTGVDSSATRRTGEGSGKSSLPKAGTFAFGAGTTPGAAAELERARKEARAREHAAAEDADLFRKMPSDADLTGVLDGGKSSCGMCGNCSGGGGIGGSDGSSSVGGGSSGGKGHNMPPWAPERLALLSDNERNVVLRKLQAKEELGRLDRDLREKQVKDRILREQRARKAAEEAKVEEAKVEEAKVDSREMTGAPVEGVGQGKGSLRASASRASDENSSAKSASDLEDEVSIRRSKTTRQHTGAKHLSTAPMAGDGNDEGLSAGVELTQASERIELDVDVEDPQGGSLENESETLSGVELETTQTSRPDAGVRGHGVGDGSPCEPPCGQCDVLESKVRDLEEQLDVLREVAALSHGKPGSGDGTSEDNLAKKSSWKSKVMNAYYGSGGTPSVERARLKEEVDALRKATDFLFAKLQESDSQPAQRSSEYVDAQLD